MERVGILKRFFFARFFYLPITDWGDNSIECTIGVVAIIMDRRDPHPSRGHFQLQGNNNNNHPLPPLVDSWTMDGRMMDGGGSCGTADGCSIVFISRQR